jgi:hypothetical protein
MATKLEKPKEKGLKVSDLGLRLQNDVQISLPRAFQLVITVVNAARQQSVLFQQRLDRNLIHISW